MADALDRALTAGLADRARHLLAAAPVVAPDALAVLTELVACVDGDCSTPEKLDYWDKREAAAWDRARALVGATPGVPEAPEARRERLSKACGEALGWNKPDGVTGTFEGREG